MKNFSQPYTRNKQIFEVDLGTEFQKKLDELKISKGTIKRSCQSKSSKLLEKLLDI